MGDEFLVNTYQNNWQRGATITTFADGSFIIVWESYFNNYEDNDPYYGTYLAAQRYDSQGRPVGGEQVIDAIDGGKSTNASITTLSDGGYVVAWVGDDYDAILTYNPHIFTRVYNANGTPRTDAIRVDTSTTDDYIVSPEVVATANGGFKVFFGISHNSGNFGELYSRQYTASGTALSQPVNLNTVEHDSGQGYALSARLTNGTSIVLWNSSGTYANFSSNELRGSLLTATGAVQRADFHLSDNIGSPGGDGGGGYDVAALQSGGFVISMRAFSHEVGTQTLGNAVLRFYDATGKALTDRIFAYGTDQSLFGTQVTQLATGEILLVWEQHPEAAGEYGEDVMGRLFSTTGKPLSAVFEIGQDGFNYDAQEGPTVAALAGGGFVVSYSSESIDGDNEGVAARIFGRGTAGNDIAMVDVTGSFNALSGNDRVTGNALANLLQGGSGSDTLYGGVNADRLYGDIGNDILVGGTEGDTLVGGLGNDLIYGGAGADKFVFASAASALNTDRIADFDAVDKLWLDNATFTSLGLTGTLKPYFFKTLGTGGVVDANDYLIYTRATGVLEYDSNGSAAGGRVVIATLLNHPVLTYDDIFVI